MLGSMRKLSHTWPFKALMALLVISFGIWGVADMFKGNPAQRAVAKVGREKITVQAVQMEFQKNLPEARKQYGPELTVDQAKKMGLLEQSLQALIDRSALDQELEAQGIAVGNDVVLKKLAGMEQFRDKDGKFNTPLFHQALGKAGLTEKTFFELERRETARYIVLNTMTGIQVPKTIADNLYKARGEKRILEVLSIANDSMHDIKQPDEAAMRAYYEENKEAFVAPEMRGFTVAALSVPALEKDIVVTDADVRKVFDSQMAAATTPETRDLIQIVVPEKDKADAIAAKASAGKSLADAAKAAGLTPIAMNKIDDKTVLPELYTAVFGLEEGGVSPAIKSEMGYHVVQVKKIHPAGKPVFENVKDEIREGLKAEKLSERVSQAMKDWDDAIAAGTPLEEIADSIKLRLTRFAAVDQFGMDGNGKKVEVPLADKLMPIAFGQNQGDVGQIIDDGKDTYYVVRTDMVTQAQPKPFEEVKAKVKARIVGMEQASLSAKAATEIADAIRKGKPATSFATRPGVEVRLSKPFSMLGDNDRSLPLTAVKQIFRMKKGDVIDVADEKSHLVLRMADIVPVDPARPEASRMKVMDDLKKSIPYDFVGLFSSYTKQQHPVRLYERTLETMKTQTSDDR